jgi:hypothetical protein
MLEGMAGTNGLCSGRFSCVAGKPNPGSYLFHGTSQSEEHQQGKGDLYAQPIPIIRSHCNRFKWFTPEREQEQPIAFSRMMP